MGATNFYESKELPKNSIKNNTLQKEVKKAFSEAVEEAQWEHGHGGYTGTIAEKSSVRYVKHFEEAEYDLKDDFIDKRLDNDNEAGDKWGPAEAITYVKNGRLFVEFFGFASE